MPARGWTEEWIRKMSIIAFVSANAMILPLYTRELAGARLTCYDDVLL